MSMWKWLIGVGGVLGALLTIGVGQAFACTSIATLNLNQPQGPVGSALTVTGSSFSTLASGASAVSIRWNGVDGPVLAQVAPDPSGSISATIQVPQNVEPGYYIVTATQTEKGGGNAFGTPARIAFQVTGPQGATSSQQGSAQTAAAAPSNNGLGIGAGTIALLAALGVLGLALFVLGAASFVGSYRKVPAASVARKR